jgi:hypothetical protein
MHLEKEMSTSYCTKRTGHGLPALKAPMRMIGAWTTSRNLSDVGRVLAAIVAVL